MNDVTTASAGHLHNVVRMEPEGTCVEVGQQPCSATPARTLGTPRPAHRLDAEIKRLQQVRAGFWNSKQMQKVMALDTAIQALRGMV